MDKVTEAVVTALKQAVADPVEQRLFRSGKLPGLFAGKTGVNGEAAALAVRDGLLEISRNEIKGKTTIEWVRLTPRGIDFLHANESPVQAIHDLREQIRLTKEGMPAWLDEIRQALRSLSANLTEEVAKMARRLDGLSQRVDDALEQIAHRAPRLSENLAQLIPWGMDAIGYLERRKTANANGACSLPELFAAVTEKNPDLSITAFHDGLRRLHEARVVRLQPFPAPPQELPQPEFALLDGATVLYYVSR
jgi:hypothetical protein